MLRESSWMKILREKKGISLYYSDLASSFENSFLRNISCSTKK